MANFLHSKKLIWVFAAVGAVAVLIMLVTAVIVQPNRGANVKPAELKVDKKDIAAGQLPEKFPADMPLETGAQITQNYNATTNDGRFQATRTFESKKSLVENMKIYTDYAQKNSWKLGTAIDQQKLKVVSATKGNLNLVVTISESLGTSTVNITITEQVAATQ